MAGNYPDPPSWRMGLDRDGTQLFLGNPPSEASHASLVATQQEGGTNGPATVNYFCFIFPELRDLDAYLFCGDHSFSQGRAGPVLVSSDTTNGIDGTWTQIQGQIGSGAEAVGLLNPQPVGSTKLRTHIASSTQLGIRAIKVNFNTNGNGTCTTAHLYGEPSPGENQDRVEIWHPTLDERVPPAYFDLGDVPRSSTEDKTFRIKNMSPDKTAQAIRVAMEALTDTTPSVPGQFTISQGGSFAAQQTIGDLAPGAVSSVLTLRRVTPSNARLSIWAHRLFAEPDSWS